MRCIFKTMTLEMKYILPRIVIIKHKFNFALVAIWEKVCVMEQWIVMLLFTRKMQRIIWVTVDEQYGVVVVVVVVVVTNILL